jgi:hypothetical protein
MIQGSMFKVESRKTEIQQSRGVKDALIAES